MTVRKRVLPEGWYPQTESAASDDLNALFEHASRFNAPGAGKAVSAVAPHASWYFSGAIAAAAAAALRRDAETVIVFGGHLSERDKPLVALEDGFSTPLGMLESDLELRDRIVSRFDFRTDSQPDNTVEILLPIVKRLFPHARAVWMRMPASIEAYRIGAAAAEIAVEIGRVVVAVGSTDLTHYGPNYGFTPKGAGEPALRWVREINDRRFIDALLGGDAETAVKRAVAEGSACSPGGAAAALGFAHQNKATAGRLIAYATSAERSPSSSFVGYAALCWEPT
jgi:AmmeMemoRadiSam system protein B